MLKESYDLSDWKKLDEILDGRRELSEIILELSIEQGHRVKLDIPNLNFYSSEPIVYTDDQQPDGNKYDALNDYISIVRSRKDFTLMRKYNN